MKSKDEVQVIRSIDGFPLMKHVLGYFPNIAHVWILKDEHFFFQNQYKTFILRALKMDLFFKHSWGYFRSLITHLWGSKDEMGL